LNTFQAAAIIRRKQHVQPAIIRRKQHVQPAMHAGTARKEFEQVEVASQDPEPRGNA
jgi:hypothetical protein